jgi:hypothetical protein
MARISGTSVGVMGCGVVVNVDTRKTPTFLDVLAHGQLGLDFLGAGQFGVF